MKDAEKRIEMALGVIFSNGGIDGAHHKQWVLDQVVRYLTGCPMVEARGADCNGKDYAYEDLGESDEYQAWVKGHNNGEDGPDTYSWDIGVAP